MKTKILFVFAFIAVFITATAQNTFAADRHYHHRHHTPHHHPHHHYHHGHHGM